MSTLKPKFAPGLVPTTLIGVAGGLATLGSDGLLLAAQRPAAVTGPLTIKGTIDLSVALPSSPANGDYYVVTKAGNGNGTFPNIVPIGSAVYYVGTNSTWYEDPDYTSTDTLPEGTTNQFFTVARAQAAAVVNSLTTASTVQAPSVTAVNTALGTKAAAFTRIKERFVLAAADISNGYITPSKAVIPFSMTAGVQGLGLIEEQTSGTTGDYKLSTYNNQVPSTMTFLNDLASGGAAALAVGDVVYLHYSW